jgi:hypothetical protein
MAPATAPGALARERCVTPLRWGFPLKSVWDFAGMPLALAMTHVA